MVQMDPNGLLESARFESFQGLRAFDTEIYFGVNLMSLDLCYTNKTCPTQTRMKTNAEP